MSFKDTIIEHPWDARLIELLDAAGVRHRRLSVIEHRAREQAWRRVYGRAFDRRIRRRREGAKAVYEFRAEAPGEWLLVPFLADVPGTQVSVTPRPRLGAFACDGPLLELAEFSDIECFISPPDFSWTFVRTHEDFVLGGPYFVRAEWV